MDTGYGEGRRPFPSGTVCREKSLTRQSELEGTDINVIVRRYEKTGQAQVNVRPGFFLDVSEVGDYRRVLELVNEAEMAFGGLPAELRAEFGNNPERFLEAVQSASPEQLEAWKLVEKAAEPPVVASKDAEGAGSA